MDARYLSEWGTLGESGRKREEKGRKEKEEGKEAAGDETGDDEKGQEWTLETHRQSDGGDRGRRGGAKRPK